MPVTETESLATHLARAPALPGPQVLDIVGQVGFALQTLHDQGRAHGDVTADSIALHDDGSVSLQPSLASLPSDIATPAAMAADLTSLGDVARRTLAPDAEPAVRDFLDRLADPPRGTTAEAGDVARTALAMAAGPLVAPATSPPPSAAPADKADRPALDHEQRRVRNRFIAIGAAAVLIGLVLLKAFGGGGHAVPNVTGDTVRVAETSLHGQGFVARERTVPAKAGQRAGIVVAQFPAAGSRPRAGSTITLSVTR
jgi:hypothetical protein